MTRSAKVTLDWADGTYDFKLGIGELEELDEKTEVGPLVLLGRCHSGSWRIGDIRETIRLGLIGGGMKPLRALALVRRYVEDRPDWLLNVKFAEAILSAAISGAKDEPLKNPEAAKDEEAPNVQTDASPSPPSMDVQP